MKRPRRREQVVWTLQFRSRFNRGDDGWTGPLGWGWIEAASGDKRLDAPPGAAHGLPWIAYLESRAYARIVAKAIVARNREWAPRAQCRVVRCVLILVAPRGEAS